MVKKMFDNDFLAIHKIKTILKFKRTTYVRMCILELSKVSMYEFHYDYIKNTYGNKSRLLFTGTDSLLYEVETKNIYDNFSKNKEMFDCSNYSAKSKYNDYLNVLIIGKMKDEIGGVAIEEFVGSKPKIYSVLVSNSSEYKKAKDVNKNVVAKISHNKYKDNLLNKKCLRHSVNKIQSINYRMGINEINKISLSYFLTKFIFLIMEAIFDNFDKL